MRKRALAACQAPLRSANAGGHYYAPAPWWCPQRFNQSLAFGTCSSPLLMACASRSTKR
jgi:hypothetical protein